MSKKKQVLLKLFEECVNKSDFRFHNKHVKQISEEIGFGNPFDATKIDHLSVLPEELIAQDYFVTHLGKGWHEFVRGINTGYHLFEPITADEHIEKPYSPSLLNHVDTSESTVLSFINNQKILQDFLYDNPQAVFNRYGARRTKLSGDYWIDQTLVSLKNQQIEIDLTVERNGIVTIFEAKNGFSSNFAVYQLYLPFRYYLNLRDLYNIPIQQVNCCYVLRDISANRLRLYQYTFTEPTQLASIYLQKKRTYQLVRTEL